MTKAMKVHELAALGMPVRLIAFEVNTSLTYVKAILAKPRPTRIHKKYTHVKEKALRIPPAVDKKFLALLKAEAARCRA